MSGACPAPAPGLDAGGFTPFPPPADLAGIPPRRVVRDDPPVSRNAVLTVAGLLGLAILLVLVGLISWRTIPGVPPPPPRPAPQSPPPTTIEAAMPFLENHAATWLPGATPSMVSMQIDWPWQQEAEDTAIPPGGWIKTVFVAPWRAPLGRAERGATLAMLYDRGSGQIVDQNVLGWENPPAQPPPWSDPPILSTEAVAIAEEASGRAFRLACPDARHATRLSLLDRATGSPVWLIDYDDARAPQAAGLVMRIDATTGDILSTRADAPPCEGETAEPPLTTPPLAGEEPAQDSEKRDKPRRKKATPEPSGG